MHKARLEIWLASGRDGGVLHSHFLLVSFPIVQSIITNNNTSKAEERRRQEHA